MKATDPKTVYSWHTKLARWIDPDKNSREIAAHKKELESMAVMHMLSRENQRLHNQRIALMAIIMLLIVLTIMAIRNCVK